MEGFRGSVCTEFISPLLPNGSHAMVNTLTPSETYAALRSDRQVAVIDIREPLDYSRGHIEESTLVPRRILESRLPDIVPTTNASVILCDQSGERAAITANDRPRHQSMVEEMITPVSASELSELVGRDGPTIIHVDTSERFREVHVPGSKWVPRYHLDQWLAENDVDTDDSLVLTCRDGHLSTSRRRQSPMNTGTTTCASSMEELVRGKMAATPWKTATVGCSSNPVTWSPNRTTKASGRSARIWSGKKNLGSCTCLDNLA